MKLIHYIWFPCNDFKYFNSLFRVLFTFPLRYLFAISFLIIFSLRWDLPPLLVLQSRTIRLSCNWNIWMIRKIFNGAITLFCNWFNNYFNMLSKKSCPDYTYPTTPIWKDFIRIQDWTNLFSFATTKRIIVIFFSFGY